MTGGRPGPAKKPSGLRLIEGTDAKGRSGRRLDLSREPIAPPGDLEPPYQLKPEAQAVWDETVAHLESMRIASPADANVLAAYVEAVVLHRKASRLVADTQILVRGDRSLVINKAILVQERAGAQLLRYAQEFGLTPAARTRVETEGSGGHGTGQANPFAG